MAINFNDPTVLNELALAIRGLKALKNPHQVPLYKVLKEELGANGNWRNKPRGAPKPKGFDPRTLNTKRSQ